MNISAHISDAEYRCRHCGAFPPSFRSEGGAWPITFVYLFEAFEDIRAAWGKPIVINCGYRCPEHNAAVGGEELSVHMFGLALDLAFDEPKKAAEVIERVKPEMRRGLYPWGCHIDCGWLIYPSASPAWVKGARW